MSAHRVVQNAIVMGTPLRPARIVVDDAFETVFVGCTFEWCEFLIAPTACALGPLFIECIITDTCEEVSDPPQLRRQHVSVGCSIFAASARAAAPAECGVAV